MVNVVSPRTTNPPVYLPNLVKIIPQYQDASGRTHENVTYWTGSVAANYTLAQLSAIAGEFLLNWCNAWAKIGATNAQVIGAVIQDVTSSSGLSEFVSQPTIGNLSTPAPINTAVLISLKQLERYKGGHGRWYLPCLGESITTDGVNVNTSLTAWTTFLADFAAIFTGMNGISSTNGGPLEPVILHARSTTPGTPVRTLIPPFTSAMTGYVVNSRLATQRRRLRKAPHH